MPIVSADPAHHVANACAAMFAWRSTTRRSGPGMTIRARHVVAHGAAYATYVGSWRKRFRIMQGNSRIARYEDRETGTTRAFCKRCGTPLYYERKRSTAMVNIPRALFQGRTGRQPLYHAHLDELQDWAYAGGPLVPLKGYPGIVWQRPKRRKAAMRRSV